MTWPQEFGGQGLGPIEQVIVNQELGRAGLPGILDVIGLGMLGPCLIAHGSDEQKTRYLGPMLHGDEVWCQLFSEPAAGSDLAAVQTRAVVQDDGSFVLNGQKVWTTNAQFAAYGLMLARTDPDVPKHKGLTMFIVPMDAPGVTMCGLRQISGEAEFNEVFFDDVRIPAENVVGGVDNGWGIALTVADVRADDDRPGLRGLRLQRRALRRARWPTTGRGQGQGRPQGAGRDRHRTAGAALRLLPDAVGALPRARSPARSPAWPRSRRSTRRSPPAT